MAEAIVNRGMGDQWEAVSAGTHPEGYVSPYAMQALGEIGIEHEGQSKHADHFRGGEFDLVVTVCDSANKECPVWLEEGNNVHLGFYDPAKASGSEKEILDVYRKVLGEIKGQIPKLLNEQRELLLRNR
jgi:arsenate reductase